MSKNVRRCRKGCDKTHPVDGMTNQNANRICKNRCGGIMYTGPGGSGLLQQANTKRPSHSQFGQRQPRTTRLQRKSISRNRYRR